MGVEMGCFSYLCPECGKGIKSSSFDGERCRLCFLVKGKIVETMTGRYDSYGRTFKDGGSHKLVVSPKMKMKPEVKTPSMADDSFEWEYSKWEDMVDMSFADDKTTGFAAIHEDCAPEDYEPTERSESDPNQGWGDGDDPEEGDDDDDE
jgi:hypothetical protein